MCFKLKFLRLSFISLSFSFFKELREDGFQPQNYLVQGVKALLTALKLWMKKEVSVSGFVYLFDDLTFSHGSENARMCF